MNYLVESSESLIGNLCSEVEALKIRSENIYGSIKNTNDTGLISRLRFELINIQERKYEVLSIANELYKGNFLDKLSVDFLREICSRAL